MTALYSPSLLEQGQKPVVCTIAGSDSSGGAGLQADLKTASSLGVHMTSVVSAITAQTHAHVSCVSAVTDDVFTAQLDAAFATYQPQVVKVGLLASARQAELLVKALNDLQAKQGVRPWLICDPVAVASNGGDLRGETSASGAQILAPILAHVDLLTPNLPELKALTQSEGEGEHFIEQAASQLLATGCKAVLVKGGHQAGAQATDRLFSHNLNCALVSARKEGADKRGTGCTLASAIACVKALGYPVEDALVVAKAYINQAWQRLPDVTTEEALLQHRGWPTQPENFPRVLTPAVASSGVAFAPCTHNPFGLYPVVDDVLWLQRLLPLGIKTIQLRIKTQCGQELEAQIAEAVELGKKYDAQVFINDHWQLAIKHGAYGVHLGQEDLQFANLEAIVTAGLRLGVSTHGYYELLLAKQLRPSYIALGHIFPTKTKDMPSQPQGLWRLARYQSLCEGLPTVAIGGISVKRLAAVAQTGVGSVAMVTAITESKDWRMQTLTMMAELAEIQRKIARGGDCHAV